MVNKLAIYGGSFDPPHLGHLQIIKAALNELEVNELIIVPNFLNPFKTEVVADGKTRIKWLQTITKDLSKVTISDFEIKQNRPTPSIVTVKHFAKNYDKIYFIIGSDNLQKLHLWSEFKTLNTLVEWVVVTRKGYACDSAYKTLHVNVDISSTTLRKNINEKYIPKQIYKEVKETYE